MAATGLRSRRRWANGRRYATEGLQLRKAHDTVGDQDLTRRCRLICLGSVVVADKAGQTGSVDAAVKRPELCPRERILNASVPGKVRPEDFAACPCVRNIKRARQWAVEVSDQPNAESSWYIHIPAKRQLVGTIQQRGSEVPARVVVVGGNYDKVLIVVRRHSVSLLAAGTGELRQTVRHLEVRRFDAAHRVGHVLLQGHLQSVINRASYGFEEVHLRLALVHSAKSARPPDSIDGRATCADVGPAAEAVVSVISHRCASGDCAIHCGTTAERGVGSCNGSICPRQVKDAGVAYTVDVNTGQCARFHIAQVIGAEYHAMADFMLNAKVQLQRPRRLIIGVQYIGCTVRAYAGRQEVADVTGVGSLQIKRIPSLHLVEEREDRRNLVADAIVIAAEIG